MNNQNTLTMDGALLTAVLKAWQHEARWAGDQDEAEALYLAHLRVTQLCHQLLVIARELADQQQVESLSAVQAASQARITCLTSVILPAAGRRAPTVLQ